MLFKSAVFAGLLASVASAAKMSPRMRAPPSDFSAPVDSKLGQRLMSSARKLEQNGQNQNQQNAEADASFMYNYYIKYESCASLIQVREEGGGQEEGILYTQNLVKFVLCPRESSCSSCGEGSAQYVVNMMEFIDAYTESQMEEQERACEYVREYCYCDNANDDQMCENQCYYDQGMDYCVEIEGEEEFEIQRYLECAELEGGNNNNNNGQNGNYYSGGNNNGVDMYRQYYIGPYCSPKDGKSIYMSAFYDAGCSMPAGDGVYEAFNYGRALPFSSEPIVPHGTCVSCEQVDENQNQNNNNNNGNNNQNYNYNQNYEVTELCQQSYEMAAKCETGLSNMQYFYPDTTGCEYINNILPRLEKATRNISSMSSVSGGSGGTAATAFAAIFAVTTLILGAYAFFLYRKIHRAKVNLAQAEMGMS